MKVYRGYRAKHECYVTVREEGKPWTAEPLDPCYHIRNHSPDGFQWGYGGSGPAQLALALVYDATGDRDRTEAIYQAFKFCVVSQLTGPSWELTDADILVVIGILEAERVARREPEEGVDG